jgi:nucleotide-binding universal stress UspA family protein
MAIEHVIIPVDFSEASLAAVEQGRALARRAGADAELLSVTSPRYANTTAAALRSLAGGSAGDGAAMRVITTDTDDIEGRLVDEVLARRNSLWCVGSHGRTAVGELLFGSISADLVRDAEVPIVVVGPHSESRPTAGVIAVALDGTDLSETILPAAMQVAGALGLTVRLLQVGFEHAASDAADTVYLSHVASTLPHPDRIDYDTLYGNADDALVDYLTRSGDVAMLALATRGIPSGARLSVPSTAMRVLRHSPVPVLMLHPAEPEPVAPSGAPVAGEAPLADARKRVVVGIDTFAASRPAVEWAATEADRLGAILQVLHTWQIPVGPGSMYGYPIWPDIEACRHAALDEAAAVVAAVAAAHPELLVETIVAEGGTVTALAKQSQGASMVVVGRHHHGRIASLLLGSVSESAVQQVDCPLVIIPCDTPTEVSAST